MCSGFCDNGAGTAGIIELARIFSEANRTGLLHPKYTLLFIAFDSEEIGIVGSANYVLQHKSELSGIVTVINIDAIGSDNLSVSMTDPAYEFDLDELVLRAAEDLGINAASSGTYQGSDDMPFKDPVWSEWLVSWFWGIPTGIADATPVKSCVSFISQPIVYHEKWNIGTFGWIHTSYDNSTSTTTLNWIEPDDLEDHLKVAALSLMRVIAPLPGDVDDDFDVDLYDAVELLVHYGAKEGEEGYDANCDFDTDGDIDLYDAVILLVNYGKKYSP